MSLYEFTTPTVDGTAWPDDHPMWRYYGPTAQGITLYKDATGWHELTDGYEEEVYANASVVYRGGRVYMVTLAEYNDLVAAGYAIALPPSGGTYPSSTTFPSAVLFPGIG